MLVDIGKVDAKSKKVMGRSGLLLLEKRDAITISYSMMGTARSSRCLIFSVCELLYGSSPFRMYVWTYYECVLAKSNRSSQA